MKNLKVTVNGVEYNVQVEELDEDFKLGSADLGVENPQITSSPRNIKQPKQEQNDTASGKSVDSPMPGTIVSVNVKVGQKVAKGDVLVVLEAMKMENEIMASEDSEVIKVNVNKGDSVDSGTPLVYLKYSHST